MNRTFLMAVMSAIVAALCLPPGMAQTSQGSLMLLQVSTAKYRVFANAGQSCQMIFWRNGTGIGTAAVRIPLGGGAFLSIKDQVKLAQRNGEVSIVGIVPQPIVVADTPPGSIFRKRCFGGNHIRFLPPSPSIPGLSTTQ